MTSNDNKFYLGYLNRLVDEYSNTYHRSTGKKPSVVDYFALTEEIKTNPQASKFESGDRVRITKYKNIFSKDCTKIDQEKYLLLILCLKLILGILKLKI